MFLVEQMHVPLVFFFSRYQQVSEIKEKFGRAWCVFYESAMKTVCFMTIGDSFSVLFTAKNPLSLMSKGVKHNSSYNNKKQQFNRRHFVMRMANAIN